MGGRARPGQARAACHRDLRRDRRGDPHQRRGTDRAPQRGSGDGGGRDEPLRHHDHARIRRARRGGADCRARTRRRRMRRPRAPAAGPGDGTRADDVPDIALAAEPEAVPDAPRVRALPRLLVPVGRGVEAPAVSRDAGAHRGVPRMVQQEPHLRAVVLYTRVLRAHLGERAPRRHRVLPRDGARGSARAVPRMVEHIPRIRLPGIRDAAPDSGAGLGSRSRS